MITVCYLYIRRSPRSNLMETGSRLFEWKGYFVCILSFFFLLTMYYKYTDELFYSTFGAVLSAWLVWGAYIVIRMIILAIRE